MRIFKEDIKLSKDFPVNVSRSVVEKDKMTEKVYHWHECLEITYIISGSGNYEVNGINYDMKENDVIVFNNIEPHTWTSNPDDPMYITVLVFDPSFICSGKLDIFDYQYLIPFNERSTTFSNKLPSELSATGQISDLIKDIEYEYEHKLTGYKLMIKTKILNILTILVRHFNDNRKSSDEINKKSRQLESLKKVLAHIEQNFSSSLPLDELSELAYMSPNYFSTFFKQATGISPVEYITRCRIAMSEQLIKNTDRTLVDIATSCGFNNMSNFYRAYKKVLGTTPTEGRR